MSLIFSFASTMPCPCVRFFFSSLSMSFLNFSRIKILASPAASEKEELISSRSLPPMSTTSPSIDRTPSLAFRKSVIIFCFLASTCQRRASILSVIYRYSRTVFHRLPCRCPRPLRCSNSPGIQGASRWCIALKFSCIFVPVPSVEVSPITTLISPEFTLLAISRRFFLATDPFTIAIWFSGMPLSMSLFLISFDALKVSTL